MSQEIAIHPEGISDIRRWSSEANTTGCPENVGSHPEGIPELAYLASLQDANAGRLRVWWWRFAVATLTTG